MSGIVFYKTKNLDKLESFYTEKIGMDLWLNQDSCLIFKKGNILLGFCESDEVDKSSVITFFFDSKAEVDEAYKELGSSSDSEPVENNDYMIYHFYSRDPEGRRLEFQTFLHPLNPYRDGVELLEGRRSIREFKDDEVPKDVFWKVMETCRFSPTSKNTENYYFKVIEDEKVLNQLASIRGGSSSPISEAPMAIAICSDRRSESRFKQDGCIASYHFMLAAYDHGLGTCWIADMDRDSVKEIIDVPKDHYVATVTPLGYPAEDPSTPSRREARKMVDFLDK